MKKIALSQLDALFQALSAEKKLYLPIEKAGQVNWHAWQSGETVRLDALNTVKSPKELFFPQTEDLMAFQMEGKSIEIIENERMSEPFVVMGVRPCDARAMTVLDRVFLAEPADTYYAARREHGAVIALACNRPEETCFCKVFGVDPAFPEGDVLCWMDKAFLYMKAATEKGASLLASVSALTLDAAETDADGIRREITEKADSQPFMGLSLERIKGAPMMELFNADAWKKLYASCLACGTCTFVCPTCQCYDIRDYDTGHGIQRFRCWDSCMYSDFTLMAHGNNRTTQLERFRQRFMHKLVYFPNNNDGMFSCVGCGRCVSKCPVHMNIVKVIKALGGETK